MQGTGARKTDSQPQITGWYRRTLMILSVWRTSKCIDIPWLYTFFFTSHWNNTVFGLFHIPPIVLWTPSVGEHVLADGLQETLTSQRKNTNLLLKAAGPECCHCQELEILLRVHMYLFIMRPDWNPLTVITPCPNFFFCFYFWQKNVLRVCLLLKGRWWQGQKTCLFMS